LASAPTRAIFSLVNAILLRKTPIAKPERMVNVYLHQASFAYSTLSYPELEDLRDGAGEAFAHIGSSQIVPAQVDGQDGIGTLLAEVVTGNYFQMLGVNAALGRRRSLPSRSSSVFVLRWRPTCRRGASGASIRCSRSAPTDAPGSPGPTTESRCCGP
jgi:hypothetical protein